jgi:hypothetical protein
VGKNRIGKDRSSVTRAERADRLGSGDVAIAASSVGIAVLSSAIMQIQGFGALPGIAIVVTCLTISQMGCLATASLRQDLLFQQQARKEPTQDRNEDIRHKDREHQRPPSATVG